MKKNILKLFLIALCCLFTAFSFMDNGKQVVASDVVVPTIINLDNTNFSSISENLGGKYKLSQDITLNSSDLGTFSGELDGDGHTIFVTDVFSIFSEIKNATIKNTKIIYIGTSTEPIELNSSFGVIAKKMSVASTIYNVEVDFSLKQNITEDEITTTQLFPIDLNLSGSYSIGTFFGESYDGSEIYNCVSLGNFNVTQLDSSASFTYVGGLVGKSENTNIRNVICNSEISLSHAESSFATSLALGGVCGYFSGENNTFFKNCVVGGSLNQNINLNTGAFVGALPDSSALLPDIETRNGITGLVSVINSNVEGFGKNNIFTKDTHYKLTQVENEYKKIDTYVNNTFWDVTLAWDSESTWKEGIKTFDDTNKTIDSRYLILLQPFENFTIRVNSNPESYATSDILTLQIDAEEDDIVSKNENEVVIKYGKPFKIVASFNEIKLNETSIKGADDQNIKYDVFFTLGDLKFENSVGKVENVIFDKATSTWTISNTQQSFEGTYIVDLLKKEYKLKATCIPMEDSELQGYVSKTSNSIEQEELEINISYGSSVQFYSRAQRYFASNGFDFYPSVLDEENKLVFDNDKMMNVNREELFGINEKRFEFKFNETDTFTTKYIFPKCDFSLEYIGFINSLFTSNVCNVIFEFVLDDEVIEDNFGIKILLDGEQLTKTSEGYVQKIIKNKDVIISILFSDFDSTKYNFVCIKDDLETEYITDLNVQSYFEFNSSDQESVVFKVCIETIEDVSSDGSIWWIIGGIGGGLLAVAVCWILIVKFRDNSYRNMYNRF